MFSRTRDEITALQDIEVKNNSHRPSLGCISLTPAWCRWDSACPPPLTDRLIALYAIAGAFTVANLYYCQPILPQIAMYFDVGQEQSSRVTTLLQAGYATGIILILPLGDFVKRRALILSLVFFTASMWIVLCVTSNFTVFLIFSYICGVTTVTPQLLVPLVGDFCRPERKAASLSILSSGYLLGLLIAKVLSGIVTNYTAWRNVYWISCGAQYAVGTLLFSFMPDYPPTNVNGLGYFKGLLSIVKLIYTQPVLIQTCLVAFFISAVFTSFWTTIPFHLSSPPFSYNSLYVGLLSLISLVVIIVIPIIGRMIDKAHPYAAILVAQILTLATVIVGTFTGNFTIAGPIVQGVGIDVGFQAIQVACRTAIFVIEPKARNRLNTAYMAAAFAGQLTGTSVSNTLYERGGWKQTEICSTAFVVASIVCVAARAPREKGYLGWGEGWNLRKDVTHMTDCPTEQENGA